MSNEFKVKNGLKVQEDKNIIMQGDGYIEGFENINYTRLVSGGEVTKASDTTIDVASGTGVWWDSVTQTYTQYTWAAQSGITLTAQIAGSDASYIMIDKTGTIQQFDVDPYADQLRNYVNLAKISHRAGSAISIVRNFYWYLDEPALLAADLAYAIGPINIDGNVYSAGSNDLTVAKSSGHTYRLNANALDDRQSPSNSTDASVNPVTVNRVYRDGSGGYTFDTGNTTIDPTKYDDGSGTLQNVLGEFWTVIRIYHFPKSNTSYLFYGLKQHEDEIEAEASIGSTEFDISDNEFFKPANFRGWLIVRQDCTDLSDNSKALFFDANRWDKGNTAIYKSTVRQQIGLPGISVNKIYIEKVDDSTISIIAGKGSIRNPNNSYIPENQYWDSISNSSVSITSGELRWVTFKWNGTYDDVELEYRETLPDNLRDFESLILIGRVWKSGTTLEVSPYHLSASLDPTVARSSVWSNKSYNISVSATYSTLDTNYLSLSAGESFLYPVIESFTSIPSHIHQYTGDTQITSMWDHLQNSTKYTLIEDNSAGDETDITRIGYYYDNNGVIDLVPSNKATVHRIGVYAQSGEIVWFRGQNLYDTIDDALLNLATEEFNIADWASDFDQISIIAYVLIRGTWTDFSDNTYVKFYEYIKSDSGCSMYGGDVSGPGASTDQSIARWDGTSGKLLQNSSIIIDDSNNISGIVDLDLTGNLTFDSGQSIDTIETTITDNDAHLPTSGAVVDYVTGFGYVDTSGTPVNNQIAVFTDANTVEGDANLTWDNTKLSIKNSANAQNTLVELLQQDDTIFIDFVSPSNSSNDGGIYLANGANGGKFRSYRNGETPDPSDRDTYTEVFRMDSSDNIVFGAVQSSPEASGDEEIQFRVTNDDDNRVTFGGDVDIGASLPVIINNTTTSTSSSTGALTVAGGVGIAENLNVGGDTDLDGSVVINESGADKDFRVESNNNANIFVVDASSDAIGIGSAPNEGFKFDIVGNANEVQLAVRSNTTTQNTDVCQFGDIVEGNYTSIEDDGSIVLNGTASSPNFISSSSSITSDPSPAIAGTLYLCDASSSAFTITLPAVSTSTNHTIAIKKTDSSANTVTIDGNSSETIDGETTQILTSQWDSVTLFCNGTSWFII